MWVGWYVVMNPLLPLFLSLRIYRWAATMDGPSLLDEAARLAPEAKSCGYTGLCLLHGLLHTTGTWQPHLLANEHPTYYGMMVALFTRPGLWWPSMKKQEH